MKSVVLISAVLAAATSARAADSLTGRWNTIDDKTGKVMSTVELYEQGSKVFGKIVGLAEPTDAAGKPKVCTACTGADKDKPVVGLVILKDLAPAGERYKGGTILDPEDGKVYKAEVWTDDGELKVRGYIGFLYRTQTWVRQN